MLDFFVQITEKESELNIKYGCNSFKKNAPPSERVLKFTSRAILRQLRYNFAPQAAQNHSV